MSASAATTPSSRLRPARCRSAKLRAAAARVRVSLSPEFRQLGADEIMAFLRGADEAAGEPRDAAFEGRRFAFDGGQRAGELFVLDVAELVHRRGTEQILAEIARGASNKEIARTLDIAEATVKIQIGRAHV